MSELRITGLRAAVQSKEILRGIDLTVRSGEVHAVMGPNGSGKSTLAHVLMGRPGYEVTGGRVALDGTDLLGLAPYERAAAGLFLVLQYPTEVPGVTVEAMLAEALPAVGADAADVGGRLRQEARRIGVDERFLGRALNVDLSGGEKKRNEILQLGMLRPRIAILDETDSGLDVDALRAVSKGINTLHQQDAHRALLVVTHQNRLLKSIVPDFVHVMVEGRIIASGGRDLATRVEERGYAAIAEDVRQGV